MNTVSAPIEMSARIAACGHVVTAGYALGVPFASAADLLDAARRASGIVSQLAGSAGDSARVAFCVDAVARLETACAVVARAVAARLAKDARARRNGGAR